MILKFDSDRQVKIAAITSCSNVTHSSQEQNGGLRL